MLGKTFMVLPTLVGFMNIAPTEEYIRCADAKYISLIHLFTFYNTFLLKVYVERSIKI